jgi:hypothetical protein
MNPRRLNDDQPKADAAQWRALHRRRLCEAELDLRAAGRHLELIPDEDARRVSRIILQLASRLRVDRVGEVPA